MSNTDTAPAAPADGWDALPGWDFAPEGEGWD